MGGVFRCRSCLAHICISRQYRRRLAYAALLMSLLAVSLLKARGTLWVVATIVTSVPVIMIVSIIVRRVIPPALALADEPLNLRT